MRVVAGNVGAFQNYSNAHCKLKIKYQHVGIKFSVTYKTITHQLNVCLFVFLNKVSLHHLSPYIAIRTFFFCGHVSWEELLF